MQATTWWDVHLPKGPDYRPEYVRHLRETRKPVFRAQDASDAELFHVAHIMRKAERPAAIKAFLDAVAEMETDLKSMPENRWDAVKKDIGQLMVSMINECEKAANTQQYRVCIDAARGWLAAEYGRLADALANGKTDDSRPHDVYFCSPSTTVLHNALLKIDTH